MNITAQVVSTTLIATGQLNDPANALDPVCTTYRKELGCYGASDPNCTTLTTGEMVCQGFNCSTSCSVKAGSVIFTLVATSQQEDFNTELVSAGASLMGFSGADWTQKFGVTPVTIPTISFTTKTIDLVRPAPSPPPLPPSPSPPPPPPTPPPLAGKYCGCEVYLDGAFEQSFAKDICTKKERNQGTLCKPRTYLGYAEQCPNGYSKCKVPSTTPEPACADTPGFTDKYGFTCAQWGDDVNGIAGVDCRDDKAEEAFWKRQGYKSSYLKTVRESCELTCGLCKDTSPSPPPPIAPGPRGPPPPAACVNKKKDSKCEKKEKKGKCYKKNGKVRAGMKKKCKKACGFC